MAANAAETPTTEIIDTSTGRVIRGAEIDLVRTVVRLQRKGIPNIQRTFIPLRTYLNGEKVELKHKLPRGRELTLVGTAPGEFWPAWKHVDLDD